MFTHLVLLLYIQISDTPAIQQLWRGQSTTHHVVSPPPAPPASPFHDCSFHHVPHLEEHCPVRDSMLMVTEPCRKLGEICWDPNGIKINYTFTNVSTDTIDFNLWSIAGVGWIQPDYDQRPLAPGASRTFSLVVRRRRLGKFHGHIRFTGVGKQRFSKAILLIFQGEFLDCGEVPDA
ncbi:MAG: hypothetical protein AAFW73_01940 [Bacteroidota bacterium]